MLELIALGHGKGIHISSKTNRAAGSRSDLGMLANDHAHHPGAPDALMNLIDPDGSKGLCHQAGRAVLLVFQLWMRMDVPTNTHEAIEDGVSFLKVSHRLIISQPEDDNESGFHLWKMTPA